MSFEKIRIVLEGDLGRHVDEVFEKFDEIPIAAASLA